MALAALHARLGLEGVVRRLGLLLVLLRQRWLPSFGGELGGDSLLEKVSVARGRLLGGRVPPLLLLLGIAPLVLPRLACLLLRAVRVRVALPNSRLGGALRERGLVLLPPSRLRPEHVLPHLRVALHRLVAEVVHLFLLVRLQASPLGAAHPGILVLPLARQDLLLGDLGGLVLLLVLLLLFGLALRRASNPFKRAPAGGVGLAGLALLLVGLEPRLLRARLDLVVVLDQVASLVGLLVCDPHLALHRLLLEDAVHLRLPLLDLGTHGLHSLVGHHSPLHHAGRPAYDVLEHLLGARRVIREGDSLPALPRARRPADAMHVVSQVTRHLEVDDRLHICDVETASGEVSGDEEVDFPRAEGFE
mmetsp:Transcript_47846/g.113922  ORF Transcript_47846/g.113922 Transcript_47846/m.113922 type:complete len:362 (+) Transcript_47846:7-1092(+)